MSPAGTKRGSINLTALGTAAVIAVYSAGYLRTKAAARRFESGEFDRRPVPAAPPSAAPVAAKADSVFDAAPIIRPDEPATPGPPKPTAIKPVETSPTAAAPATKDSVPPADSTGSSAPVALPVAPVADSAKSTTDSVKQMKDGVYKGWGTSRHGDIEAAVEIRAGRIVNAYITQCLTRYSCERIAVIIPQVVARQSAEVDYVSGATQSTNAFYYAIVEALSKAK
jgi:uncharacterized protein with FMN-binding domain